MFDIRPLSLGDAAPPRSALRPEVAAALAAAPGPELLTGLLSCMASDLSAREWLECTRAWKAMSAFCAGGELASIAELDRGFAEDGDHAGPGHRRPSRGTADEVAAALHIAPQAASRLVALARRVDDDLPAAADALADGRMDLAQVRALAAVTRDLPATARRGVEALAVRRGPTRTVGQLEDDLETEAARLAPEHAASRARSGVAERDVQLRRSPVPGCRRLVADLPATQATAAWLAVNGAAVKAKDGAAGRREAAEVRTLAQLRADALTSLLTGRAATDHATGEGLDVAPVRLPTPAELATLAEVQVVVAADTLTGTSDLPASIPGVGPLDVDTIRDLAARTRWRRLVADPATGRLVAYGRRTANPTGTARAEANPTRTSVGALLADPRWKAVIGSPVEAAVLDVGLSWYAPSPALRAHVHTRDASCIGVACHHPARGTQLDHTVPFRQPGEDGALGTTSEDNLGSQCRRTHNAKTHGGWSLTQPEPGSFRWTSPLGRVYSRLARPLVPGWPGRRQDDQVPGAG